jgi:hypothetical protein
MTDFERYLVGEHIEDFRARLISRRELLRRVTLITGSIAGALLLLEAARLLERTVREAPLAAVATDQHAVPVRHPTCATHH